MFRFRTFFCTGSSGSTPGWEGRRDVDGSRAPARLVELLAILDAQELPEEVPYFDPVVDPQSRGERSGEDELAAGGPIAVRRVGGVDGRYLGMRAPTIDDQFAREITEAAEKNEPRLRVEFDEVVESRPKIVQRPDALIEEPRSRGHDYKRTVRKVTFRHAAYSHTTPNSFELGLQAKS